MDERATCFPLIRIFLVEIVDLSTRLKNFQGEILCHINIDSKLNFLIAVRRTQLQLWLMLIHFENYSIVSFEFQ